MGDFKQQQYQTKVTALTTELNSLASGSASAASGALGGDTTDAEIEGDWIVLTGGSITPGTGARCDIYLIRAADGTNYEDATTGASESLPPDACIGSAVPTSGAGTKRFVLRDQRLPPGLFKVILQNELGVSLPASGNTLEFRPHSMQNL